MLLLLLLLLLRSLQARSTRGSTTSTTCTLLWPYHGGGKEYARSTCYCIYIICIYVYTVRVHGCKAFVLGKKGTISHGSVWSPCGGGAGGGGLVSSSSTITTCYYYYYYYYYSVEMWLCSLQARSTRGSTTSTTCTLLWPYHGGGKEYARSTCYCIYIICIYGGKVYFGANFPPIADIAQTFEQGQRKIGSRNAPKLVARARSDKSSVRVHGCKAFVLGKKGTISHARHGAGAHVKESKVPAQGLLSTSAGMLAMHREIGSAPRPDCTRTWSVVDALHHQNIYTFWAQAWDTMLSDLWRLTTEALHCGAGRLPHTFWKLLCKVQTVWRARP